jgi:hypothetical protein
VVTRPPILSKPAGIGSTMLKPAAWLLGRVDRTGGGPGLSLCTVEAAYGEAPGCGGASECPGERSLYFLCITSGYWFVFFVA